MKLLKRLAVIIIFVILIYILFNVAPYYLVEETYEEGELRLVINSTEVTKKLPQSPKIIDGQVMLSIDTVDIYFDKYIYYDEKYDTIITTTNTVVAKLQIGKNEIQINNNINSIEVPAQVIDDEIYIPIEALKDIYNIEVEYNEKIIISKQTTERKRVILGEDLTVYKYKKILSRKIENVKANDILDIYEEDGDWLYVRTSIGNLGYVQNSKMYVSEVLIQILPIDNTDSDIEIPKINLVWEYAEYYTPDRTGEERIENLDVVSPTWFYLKDTEGNVTSKVKEDYVTWAHNNKYEVWAAFKNDGIGIEGTSIFMNDMKARENTINQIVKYAKQYKLDGINMDFEEMKKEDSNKYSQFIRETAAILRSNGFVVSVDVNIPDGSDTWSLCYNSKHLSDAVDYIIVMTYDQYYAGSKVPGSVAEYNWVEENIVKMVERDEIPNNKLMLGIPFYSRLWTVKNEIVTSKSITMKDAVNILNENKDVAKWLEEEKQYYVEFKEKGSTIMLWVEDQNSIAEKVKLVNKYKLAGVAAWRKGYEISDIWKVIEENMN